MDKINSAAAHIVNVDSRWKQEDFWVYLAIYSSCQERCYYGLSWEKPESLTIGKMNNNCCIWHRIIGNFQRYRNEISTCTYHCATVVFSAGSKELAKWDSAVWC